MRSLRGSILQGSAGLRAGRTLLALLAGLWLAAPAAAQWIQYTPPGSLAERPEPRQERLERVIEEAPWRLGPVHVQPWLGLRNAGYVDPVDGRGPESGSDVTATVGAGLRGYLRTGPNVVWAASVQPEYVWWRKSEERRRWNQRFGAGVFAFFNRFHVEALGRRDEEQRIFTAEIDREINFRRDLGELRTSLVLTGGLSVAASAALSRIRSLTDEDPDPGLFRFGALDRDEEVLRAGLRLRPGRPLELGAGIERSRVDFLAADERDLSNEGSSPYVELIYRSPTVFAQIDLVFRSVEPRGGSEFPAYEEPTGRALVELRSHRPLGFQLYGARNLVYSLQTDLAYFEDDRVGLGATLRAGWRTLLLGFVEVGRHDYTPLDPGGPGRRDDYRTVGGRLTLLEVWKGHVTVGADRTRWDSDVAVLARTVTRLHVSVGFGALGEPF